MARIRTVKPEFFTSEDIVELSAFARLLYIALWCESDREGRMVWKPRTFKMRYFPADALDMDGLCQELIESGLVVLYGEGLAYIPSFQRHQHVNPRESKSELPDPLQQKARVDDASARVSDVQGGREGKEIHNASLTRAEDFNRFWAAYPKKKNKGDAEKAFLKLKPSAELLDRMLQAVEVACQSDDWRKSNGQYIPYPASWLNAKGWEDESVAEASVPVWDR